MASRVGDETIRNVDLVNVTDPLIGQIVEQYRIESLVGSGAMGMVYRGVHQVIGKTAAIKVLRVDFADDPEMVQRLVREARTVNAIRHPAIVDIFGFGTLPRTEQPYIVMDLLEGTPLDEFIKKHAPLKLRAIAPFIDEILSALAAAHAVGVIHRDLKPGNVFVESKPDGQHGIKVIDFGLAKQADRAGGSVRPTNPGTLLGTPAFMAPEQVMGTKVSPATDLYAVGGIAYQLLTNHLPHEAPTAIDVLSQKMHHDPIAPKQWQPWIDDELNGWVMTLLAREPEKRFQTAEDARRAWRRLVDGRTNSDVPRAQSGKNAALQRPTGLVPKRDWGDAKTEITDTDSAPLGAGGVNPLDAIAEKPPSMDDTADSDAQGVEPTAPPLQSPFVSSRTPAPTRLAPAAEPLRRKHEPEPTLPFSPRVHDAAETPLVNPAAGARETDPDQTVGPALEAPPSNVPLYLALGVALVALLLGLAYLVLK